jgi:hypothetical protein
MPQENGIISQYLSADTRDLTSGLTVIPAGELTGVFFVRLYLAFRKWLRPEQHAKQIQVFSTGILRMNFVQHWQSIGNDPKQVPCKWDAKGLWMEIGRQHAVYLLALSLCRSLVKLHVRFDDPSPAE